MKVTGIKCTDCGDKIWSRHRHDFRWCSCKTVAIDGGRAYTRVVGDPNKIESVEIEIED